MIEPKNPYSEYVSEASCMQSLELVRFEAAEHP